MKKEKETSSLVSVQKWLPQKSGSRSVLQLPGDRTPFGSYQRKKLIRLLNFGRFVGGRSVLEIGCGVGDLMLEIHKFGPKDLYGVDRNAEFLEMARQNLKDTGADLTLSNSADLPFPEKSFDVVLVMYELQHIDDEDKMQAVVDEAARVSRHWVILVEETALQAYRKDQVLRRPVSTYKAAFKKAKTGRFFLRQFDYLHVSASRYIFTGTSNPWHWIRWLLSPLLYLMGFPASWMKPPLKDADLPESKFALFLQKLSLPFTTSLDGMFRANKGTTVMWFEREKLFGRGNRE